ncbi:MAG: hypothetical protein IJS78_06825 [Clostridia bacterium]|nr:hypothetical protein [Clostridia bacterium]
MSDHVTLSFWNYNAFSGYKPEMLRDWVNCGMTDPVAPMFRLGKDDKSAFLGMLDDAEKLGVRMILQIDGLFLDNALGDGYKETVERVVREFGSHPAAAGYYVGEEPSDENAENYRRGIRVIRDADPDAHIYVNMGSIERTERMLLSKSGQTLEEWCTDLAAGAGGDVIGFGSYNQMLYSGGGLDDHFYNVRNFVEIGKKLGVEIWATVLSSAHYNFRVPTEDDFRWQLNTCVACGCRGVIWFRLYDKLIAADYHGSPIDEFGEKTVRYHDLARVQKKFNYHYGKLFSRLEHVSTAGIGTSWGGYFYFLPGAHDLVDAASSRSAMISFFKDGEGTDYAVVFNTLQRESTFVTLSFSEKVKAARAVYRNGEEIHTMFERGETRGSVSSGEIWLTPGQMEVIRLERAD